MKQPSKSLLIVSAVCAGFLSFIINGALTNPFLILSLIGLVILSWRQRQGRHHVVTCFFPFSSGLLSFFLRLFFWDRFDLAHRMNNLVLLSFLFSLFLLARHYRILPRWLRRFNRFSLKKRLLLIFFLFQLVFTIASYVLVVEKRVVLVGDEPHYLAVAQSIARDGDFNVFNQYYRDGYREFIEVDKLKAHAAFGRGFKKMYSYHLPGISLTISPFLAGKIPLPLLYFLVRSYLALFASLLMVLVYLFCLKLWRHRSLALYITLVFGFTTPVFFHSFHIFPEIQALLLILSSLYLLLYGRDKPFTYLISGLLLAVSVFWGLKYAIFIYLICGGVFFYLAFKKRYKQALLFVAFPLLFQGLFFYYLYFAYGSFSPQSIYRGMMTADQSKELYHSLLTQIPLRLRIETLLDYFLDQRDGLLLYNPFYFFALPGLILAIRKFKHYYRYLWFSIPAAAYIIYHALSTVRAGHCPQGRYLVPVVWFLMLFCVVYYRESKNRVMKRVMIYSPLYALLVTIFQIFNPFTLYQPTTHDSLFRPGLLFQKLSNTWISLPDFMPSFVKVDGNAKHLPNLLILAVIVLLCWFALRKFRLIKLDIVIPLLFFCSFVLFVLFPRISLYNPVVVQRNGVLPHRIHGASHYPGNASHWLFHLKEDGTHPITLSTPRAPGSIEIELTNRGETQVECEVILFDNVVANGKLTSGERSVFIVNEPQSRRFRGSFYYRLYIRIKSPGSKDPWVIVEFSPLRLSRKR